MPYTLTYVQERIKIYQGDFTVIAKYIGSQGKIT